MKKFIGITAHILSAATFGICIALGVIAGYAVGDELLEAANYTQPKDFIQYRVVFPIIGAILIGGAGFFVADWVHTVILKLNNFFKTK